MVVVAGIETWMGWTDVGWMANKKEGSQGTYSLRFRI